MGEVWVLETGALDEAVRVLGVYGLRSAAVADFVEQTFVLDARFGDIDRAWQEDNGALYLEAGCGWLRLTPHPVVMVPQLTPAGK